MSLNHKFTWGDFLKQNPELKKKKIKRTSPEGEKAFQAAFKDFSKVFLKEREDRLKKVKTVATKKPKKPKTKKKD